MIQIGKSGIHNISFDLPNLIETRLLIQANSGGGKSYAIRRLLEQSHGHVQQIVLDLEGEFSTLREKYDYIIAGKDGDTPAHPSSANLLARRLLELKVSAICDLYELPKHDRIRFVRYFLESLVNAPRSLWQPVLVVLDEAHHFAPEKGQVESYAAVIDLATRGRKRGLCAVLATQRLSKLHKDVCAELLNKMVGRTSLDIDQARAADELGIIGKQDRIALRLLKPGEFHIYGPALRSGAKVETGVIKTMVGKVESHHPKVGSRKLIAPPKPTSRIKKILSQVRDLPEEAKKEARDLASLKKDNADLRRKLTIAEKQGIAKSCNHEPVVTKLKKDVESKDMLISKLNSQTQLYRIFINNMLQSISKVGQQIKGLEEMVRKTNTDIKEIKVPPKKYNPNTVIEISSPSTIQRSPRSIRTGNKDNGEVTGGARRMLEVLASRHLMKTTKAQLATLSRLKKTSGTFGTYQSTLVSNGLIVINNGDYSITNAGFEYLGTSHIEPKTSEEIQEMWRQKLSGGALRMFDYLLQIYPEEISKEDLAVQVGLTYGTGTWGTYLSALRSNDLINENGNMLKANETLFE
ncbi:MAG: DUF87 domain-containing protein [Candidatus Zixiibacteriota bacterium]|nr:MAG: DUF87 domain-containing protein [candidate division Zixibacteria bacterium]